MLGNGTSKKPESGPHPLSRSTRTTGEFRALGTGEFAVNSLLKIDNLPSLPDTLSIFSTFKDPKTRKKYKELVSLIKDIQSSLHQYFLDVSIRPEILNREKSSLDKAEFMRKVLSIDFLQKIIVTLLEYNTAATEQNTTSNATLQSEIEVFLRVTKMLTDEKSPVYDIENALNSLHALVQSHRSSETASSEAPSPFESSEKSYVGDFDLHELDFSEDSKDADSLPAHDTDPESQYNFDLREDTPDPMADFTDTGVTDDTEKVHPKKQTSTLRPSEATAQVPDLAPETTSRTETEPPHTVEWPVIRSTGGSIRILGEKGQSTLQLPIAAANPELRMEQPHEEELLLSLRFKKIDRQILIELQEKSPQLFEGTVTVSQINSSDTPFIPIKIPLTGSLSSPSEAVTSAFQIVENYLNNQEDFELRNSLSSLRKEINTPSYEETGSPFEQKEVVRHKFETAFVGISNQQWGLVLREQSINNKATLLDSTYEISNSPEKSIYQKGSDVALSRPDLGLIAVFDGVSGSGEGDKAARFCAETVEQRVEQFLRENPTGAKDIDLILQDILEELGPKLEKEGIEGATTAAVIFVYDDVAYIASIGDARAFIYRPFNSFDQLKTLNTEDNEIARTFKEYPKLVEKINGYLDKYTGEMETLPDTELPVPTDYRYLQRLLSQYRQDKSPTPAKLMVITGLEEILDIFETNEDTGIIQGNDTKRLLAAFFKLRAIITQSIKPFRKYDVRLSQTPVGLFDTTILDTDGFDSITEQKRLEIIENSRSGAEILHREIHEVMEALHEHTVRAKRDDAVSVLLQQKSYQEMVKFFDTIEEDYVLRITKEIVFYPQEDFPDFYESLTLYQQAKEKRNWTEAKKYLLQMVTIAENYAISFGLELPPFPVYRDDQQEISFVRLASEVWSNLSPGEQDFITEINRYYQWGGTEQIERTIQNKFPTNDILLRRQLQEVLTAIQTFVHSPTLKRLLANQEALLEQERKLIETEHNKRLLAQSAADKFGRKFAQTPSSSPHGIDFLLEDSQQNPYDLSPKPKNITAKEFITPRGEKLPPLKKSWLKSIKTRVAATLLSLGQAFFPGAKPQSDRINPSELPPAVLSLNANHATGESSEYYYDGKEGIITSSPSLPKLEQTPPNTHKEIIPETKKPVENIDMEAPTPTVDPRLLDQEAEVKVKVPEAATAKEADMQYAPERVSALDAGLLVKIPSTPDAGMPGEEATVEQAREQIAIAVQKHDILEESKETIQKREISIQRGEGVSQAILRDLKNKGIDAALANTIVLKAVKSYTFPIFVKLGDIWNYTFDTDAMKITTITHGPTQKESLPEKFPAEQQETRTEKPTISQDTSVETSDYSQPHVDIETVDQKEQILYLNKTTGEYEPYTLKTEGVAPGSVALIGEKVTTSGKKVKFQFAVTEETFKKRSLDPKKIDIYKAEKIAVQKLDENKDRIIFTKVDGGIVTALFHYLIAHKNLTPIEAFKIANDLESQGNIPAEKRNLTYPKLPDLVHVGDSIIISHTTNEKGQTLYTIEAIQKQKTSTELPILEVPMVTPVPKIEIEDSLKNQSPPVKIDWEAFP